MVRKENHPTKVLLIETAIELIDEFGPQGFTVETLLETSKISKGSLYHHFEDFSDVIEQAQVARFSRQTETDAQATIQLLQGAPTQQEWLDRMVGIIKASSSPERAPFRSDRATIIGLSRHSKRLADALAVEQQRVTDSFSDIAREMQEKGWLRKDLNPRAVGTFAQAYTFGFVLNDITSDPLSLEEWTELLVDMWKSFLT